VIREDKETDAGDSSNRMRSASCVFHS